MNTLKNLNKTYNLNKSNAFQALKDINLTIEDGEMVAIMGASGAGKSTLLHILGTLEKYDSGSYYFADKDMGGFTDKQLSRLRCQKIGFVLQDFGLIADESVLSNVTVPLYFDNTSMKQLKSKAENALETVGILNLKKKRVRHLSGGQKQRVAIARAIVNEPSLILADEPTGSLDSQTSDEILNVFEMLNQQGKTIVIVTHSHDVANHCNRIVNIIDGEIVD